MTQEIIDGPTAARMFAACGGRAVDGMLQTPDGGCMGFLSPKPAWLTEIVSLLSAIDADKSPFRLESFA